MISVSEVIGTRGVIYVPGIQVTVLGIASICVQIAIQLYLIIWFESEFLTIAGLLHSKFVILKFSRSKLYDLKFDI